MISAQTSTGPRSPEDIVTMGAGINWSSVGQIVSSNDAYAGAGLLSLAPSSNILIATNFGFSIPATDIIDGIKVEIEKNSSVLLATIRDNSVQLTKNGTHLIGQNKKSSTEWPTSDIQASYGGSSDLWGSAWTPAEINSPSFGLGVSAVLSGLLAATARIDHIRITVYHHPSVLPITLSRFDAMVTKNNSVRLHWSTASETNNNFFTVERSTDGEAYVALAEVPGSGNSNSPRHYSYEDIQPHIGRNFYRLKQTDFDGSQTYARVAKVDYDGPQHPVLTVMPISSTRTSIDFTIVGIPGTREIRMTVCDLQGKILAERHYAVAGPGSIEAQLELDTPLSAGLYIIKAGPGFYLTRKFAVR